MKQRTLGVLTVLLGVAVIALLTTYIDSYQSRENALASITSANVTSNRNQFSISLASSRTNYSIGENIVIFGNLSHNNSGIANQSITIEAAKDSAIYYQTYVTSDNQGRFVAAFPIPTQGITRISATPTQLASNNTAIKAIVAVSINEKPPELPKWIEFLGIIVPFFSIIANVAIIAISYPRHETKGLILATISATIGSFFLFLWSPASLLEKSLIETAVLGSLVGYVYESLKERRMEGRKIEAGVGTYRDGLLKKEVQGLSDIFEELSSHQSIFKSANDILNNKLSKEKYKISIKTGTMANLPGLRINQYYFYVDYYNKLLEHKLKRLGELSDDKKYQEFVRTFGKIKNTFSRLNESLYVNILYSIGEIQSRFLSYPTIEFPTRISGPLLDRLRKANVFAKNGISDTNIYSRKNANKLMSVIGPEFIAAYLELEHHLSEITKFVPPPSDGGESENGQPPASPPENQK